MAQVAGGREMLLGARRDQSFGPVVAFGAGGIETEILADVALRVAPISPAQARDLMAETRIGRLLAGFRGQPARRPGGPEPGPGGPVPIHAAVSPNPGSGPQPGPPGSRPTRPPGPGRPDQGGPLTKSRSQAPAWERNLSAKLLLGKMPWWHRRRACAVILSPRLLKFSKMTK